jgi:DNA invertase Pin-like site-specific DNA recombinase
MLRCAVYARFSSDLQRDTSIEDQVRVCREYAARHEWTVLEPHIYSDEAVSGDSLERRSRIQALLRLVEQRPLPFDVVLVDDSSRVARDIADAIRIVQRLKFNGVRAIYISQGIDSANEQAETLVAVHGLVDGLYLREMSAKVKRGMRGQLERGFATGGITFGYRTVPVPDSSGKTEGGLPVFIGHRVEIQPDQARVVRQIFTWYADGFGAQTIVERLNRAGVTGPRGHTWNNNVVKRLLQNEKYTGKLIWGKHQSVRRPGSHQRVARPVPKEEWRVRDCPDLRIIDDDLWARVQARRTEIRTLAMGSRGQTLMRGRNAALFSKHLFSGFMRCAICGASVSAVYSGHGSPRYGCWRSHCYGVTACANRLTIRTAVADPLLLAGLKDALLEPATVKYIVDTVATELNRASDDRPVLLAEATRVKEETRERLQRLVQAIEAGGPVATLVNAVREREAELARLEATLAELSEPLAPRLAIMPGWIRQQLEELASLLSEVSPRAKAEFRRLGLTITMQPIHTEGVRPFYRAIGTAIMPFLGGTRDLARSSTPRSGWSDLGGSQPRILEQNPQGSSTARSGA